MLLPKRVKYRRVQRGRLKGKATRGNVVTYGDFGLQAWELAWITSNQIEAARIAVSYTHLRTLSKSNWNRPRWKGTPKRCGSCWTRWNS